MARERVADAVAFVGAVATGVAADTAHVSQVPVMPADVSADRAGSSSQLIATQVPVGGGEHGRGSLHASNSIAPFEICPGDAPLTPGAGGGSRGL